MGFNKDIEITVSTIQMQPPLILPNGITKKRTLKNKDKETGNRLIAFESQLRKEAYKDTIINIDKSFFDDSDMKSDYFLTVVYDRITDTPLLSSRHFYDKKKIAKDLNGDKNITFTSDKFNLDCYPHGKVFLADRLSGNRSNLIYVQNRATIFSIYYAEIMSQNIKNTLILMVKKDKHNQQLNKYKNLGFTVVGSTIHKGKNHSIIIRDLI